MKKCCNVYKILFSLETLGENVSPLSSIPFSAAVYEKFMRPTKSDCPSNMIGI